MPRVTFNNRHSPFYQAIQKAASEYFKSHQLKPTGNWILYRKALFLVTLALFLYIFLLTGNYNSLTGIILSVVLGLTLSGIATNVMHDACHGSFSSKKWINELTGLSMNALGSNAFLWKVKHNIIHHTYTNITGVDSDIENWPVLRQTPAQKCLPIHRYQYFYMFFLYAITTLHWMVADDFEKYFTRRFASTPIRHISLQVHLVFWLSKLLYVFFYIALPIYLLGWQTWLTGFIIMHLTMGLLLTTVFQLAHLVEKTTFENGEPGRKIEEEWAIHELRTTANFAIDNRIITWYLGGLNYQVEHHLFSRVSHIHYPALSKIIQHECEKFGLTYNNYKTVQEAVVSHISLMKKLGRNNSANEIPINTMHT
jgi:linoleoyl-CoA desaturase